MTVRSNNNGITNADWNAYHEKVRRLEIASAAFAIRETFNEERRMAIEQELALARRALHDLVCELVEQAYGQGADDNY